MRCLICGLDPGEMCAPCKASSQVSARADLPVCRACARSLPKHKHTRAVHVVVVDGDRASPCCAECARKWRAMGYRIEDAVPVVPRDERHRRGRKPQRGRR